jgi:hypothetical protein
MSSQWKPIVLSAKVFGHLSQGLYRTPAGAIKELISNSFDADARIVRIHTDFPRFTTFSCEDDGDGMEIDEFKRLMDRGIGSSYKRIQELGATKGLHRPYIGRLGLGILALAQICTQFDIVSHHKDSKRAFKATIKFPPYTREEMDKIAKRAARTNASVRGGEFRFQSITYDEKKPGVRIFTKYPREQFRKVMANLERFGNRKKGARKVRPYGTFSEFLDTIYSGPKPLASLNLLSEYDTLLFGLALASPLPFAEARNVAVRLPLIAQRQKALKSFAFEVLVDNLALLHPVCLPSIRERFTAADCELGESEKLTFTLKDGPVTQPCPFVRRSVSVKGSDLQFSLYEFSYDSEVAKKRLAFSGYFFQQTGRLYPRDIQGVLIRINNVAIGKYDSGMLTYPYAEGPRYSMVSSELFIEAGFEDGLNIDRDSFNELHPHYIRVQAFLHGVLHERIFRETWTEEKTRNEKRRVSASAAHDAAFKKSFKAATGDTIRQIKHVDRSRDLDDETSMKTASVDFIKRGDVQIDRSHPLLHALAKKKKYLPLVERLIIAFERANRETNAATRRSLFYKLLLDIVRDI